MGFMCSACIGCKFGYYEVRMPNGESCKGDLMRVCRFTNRPVDDNGDELKGEQLFTVLFHDA